MPPFIGQNPPSFTGHFNRVDVCHVLHPHAGCSRSAWWRARSSGLTRGGWRVALGGRPRRALSLGNLGGPSTIPLRSPCASGASAPVERRCAGSPTGSTTTGFPPRAAARSGARLVGDAGGAEVRKYQWRMSKRDDVSPVAGGLTAWVVGRIKPFSSSWSRATSARLHCRNHAKAVARRFPPLVLRRSGT
jgi:hypothetical protein